MLLKKHLYKNKELVLYLLSIYKINEWLQNSRPIILNITQTYCMKCHCTQYKLLQIGHCHKLTMCYIVQQDCEIHTIFLSSVLSKIFCFLIWSGKPHLCSGVTNTQIFRRTQIKNIITNFIPKYTKPKYLYSSGKEAS